MAVRASRLVASLALLAIAAGASARTDPPELRTTFQNGMITSTDMDSGYGLIRPNGLSVVSNTTAAWSASIQKFNNGFDLTITLTNNTGEPVPLGDVAIGGVRLPQRIWTIDARRDTKLLQLDHGGQNYFWSAHDYPSQLYSPVLVFGDGDRTIGMSLQYPVLDYHHDVRPMLISPGGIYNASGRNWQPTFKLLGSLPPGQTRQYGLSFRVVRHDDSWLRTLTPYRRFFWETYGGTQYERDPRPVWLYTLASIHHASADNPYGFQDSANRPDLLGWQPVSRDFRTANSLGFNRIMIWAPTGVYRNNPDLNFPFLFMTHMDAVPAMAASKNYLAAVASPMLDVGFWWGRSQQVMRNWDQPQFELLDPDNPDHVQRAFAELDQARALNAHMIGLDAFAYMDPVDAYHWLTRLKEHAPEIKFIIEPATADILHSLSPQFTYASLVETPHLLADFLLPGHESWAMLRFDIDEDELGRPLTNAEKHEKIQRVADLGYVPVFTRTDISGYHLDAAESWRFTVPEDLRADRPRLLGDPHFAEGPDRVKGAIAPNPNVGPDEPSPRQESTPQEAPPDEQPGSGRAGEPTGGRGGSSLALGGGSGAGGRAGSSIVGTPLKQMPARGWSPYDAEFVEAARTALERLKATPN